MLWFLAMVLLLRCLHCHCNPYVKLCKIIFSHRVCNLNINNQAGVAMGEYSVLLHRVCNATGLITYLLPVTEITHEGTSTSVHPQSTSSLLQQRNATPVEPSSTVRSAITTDTASVAPSNNENGMNNCKIRIICTSHNV